MKSAPKRVREFCQTLETADGSYPLVIGIVNAHIRLTGTPADNDDIRSEGYIGLLTAAVRHRKNRGAVTTFATHKVISAVKDWIRKEAIQASRFVTTDVLEDVALTDSTDKIALKQQREIVLSVVGRSLNEFEYAMIVGTYWLELDNYDLARRFHCSLSKVTKAKQRAMIKLRVALTNRGIATS